MTYAVGGKQSGSYMHNYKSAVPVREAFTVVGLLLMLGLKRHTNCLGLISDEPVSRWATVPSYPRKSRTHPLHRMAGALANTPETEVSLVASDSAAGDSRQFDASHYSVTGGATVSGHVLLVEDTWTSGGHAQSAAAALRRAGASEVSLLAVSRFLAPSWNDTDVFIDRELRDDFDPTVCPWTGGRCPAR